VVAPGVGLDDEAGGLEEEIDLLAGDGRVDAGLGQAVVVAKLAEQDLEAAARQIRARVVRLQGGQELVAPVVAGVGSGQGSEGGIVGQLEDLVAVEDVLEVGGLEARGEVEDRAGGGGDRDGVLGGRLVGAERAAELAAPTLAEAKRAVGLTR